ncbi:hypothetical protein [Rhodococcus sp. NPDC058481]|uniref:hypothetical protein n=1 Tax=unclassified Rhodococcus (in: high G+C Gram-positive bacteria) TaxID=192944 RepID=UPI0036526633
MTSLVVWSAADTHGPASLNVATDSRISWGQTHYWDQAKKVFAASTKPLVVGFLGDVLFPTLSIPAVLDRIDRGMLDGDSPLSSTVVTGIRSLWRDYPDREQRSQKILIAHRVGDGMTSKFRLTVMTHEGGSNSHWSMTDIAIPDQSAALVIDGSGAPGIHDALTLWQASTAGGTSRAVFSAFVESVVGGRDPLSGGAPQLGSLYRIGNGRLLGVVHDNQRYFAGARLLGDEDSLMVEWRNALFEITDGRRKRRMDGAQVHLPR